MIYIFFLFIVSAKLHISCLCYMVRCIVLCMMNCCVLFFVLILQVIYYTILQHYMTRVIKDCNSSQCIQSGNHKLDILQMQANWVSFEPQSPTNNPILLLGRNVGKYYMGTSLFRN